MIRTGVASWAGWLGWRLGLVLVLVLVLGLAVGLCQAAVAAGAGEHPALAGGWDGDPLRALHRVELGWVRSVQGDGGWGWLMRGVSALGPGGVMWAGILAVFFGGWPRLAVRLVGLTLLALWLRELLALALQSPRPYWIDPQLQSFGDVATRRATYGLPSGHAFVGTAFWMFLAAEVRRAWAWCGALVVVLGIAASRVYLGVHFVSDVVLGMVLGGAFVGAFRWVEARMCRWSGGAVVPGLATGAEDEANARHGLGCLPGRRLEVGVALAGLAAAMVGLGWGVRAWVASVDLPGGWAMHAAHARGGSVLALVGLCFFGWVGVRAVLGWGWLARWEVRVAPGHRLLRAAVAGVGAVAAHDAVSRLLSTS